MTRAQKYNLANRIVRIHLRQRAEKLGIPGDRFELVWADVLTETPFPRSYHDLCRTMQRRHEDGVYT